MPKSAASPSILLNNRSSVFFNRYCLYLRRAQRGVFVCFFMFRMFLPVRALVCAGSILPRTWAARSSPIFTEKGGFGGLELANRAEKAVFCKVARSSYLPASRFESARPPRSLIFSALFCGCVSFSACARPPLGGGHAVVKHLFHVWKDGGRTAADDFLLRPFIVALLFFISPLCAVSVGADRAPLDVLGVAGDPFGDPLGDLPDEFEAGQIKQRIIEERFFRHDA